MSKKNSIFGANFGFKTDFKWPRVELSYLFKGMVKWDWAAWFWFIVLVGIASMGIAAVLIQMFKDPITILPATGGWDG